MFSWPAWTSRPNIFWSFLRRSSVTVDWWSAWVRTSTNRSQSRIKIYFCRVCSVKCEEWSFCSWIMALKCLLCGMLWEWWHILAAADKKEVAWHREGFCQHLSKKNMQADVHWRIKWASDITRTHIQVLWGYWQPPHGCSSPQPSLLPLSSPLPHSNPNFHTPLSPLPFSPTTGLNSLFPTQTSFTYNFIHTSSPVVSLPSCLIPPL